MSTAAILGIFLPVAALPLVAIVGGLFRLNRSIQASIVSAVTASEARMTAGIASLRTDLKADIASLRTDLKIDISDVRLELRTGISTLHARIDALPHGQETSS